MNINVIGFGGGVNSTAMIVGMVEKGIDFKLILFADTGGERPDTYKFVGIMDNWLKERNLPRVTTVKPNKTLEEDCLTRNALPSVAYGFRTCSLRFKKQPQDKFLNNWEVSKEVWKSGGKVIKNIGFDAGEWHRIKTYEDKKYVAQYPLVDWGWDRDKCKEAIIRAGLPMPGKSSCFYCPSMKKHEILLLNRTFPELAKRAIEMERNADLREIKGLARNFSWENLIKADKAQIKMFPETENGMVCECYYAD